MGLKIPNMGVIETMRHMNALGAARRDGKIIKPMLLQGTTGVGKSMFVRAFAKMLGAVVSVVELAHCDPSDLAGLPYMAGNKHRWTHPWWWPENENDIPSKLATNLDNIKVPQFMRDLGAELHGLKDVKYIIFLDEYTRAHKDTLNVAMNLVGYGELHGSRAPKNTWIIAACNPSEDRQMDVSELDKANRDRLAEVTFCPTMEEWTQFVSEEVHPAIITYALKHDDCFMKGNKEFEEGLSFRTAHDIGVALKKLCPPGYLAPESDSKADINEALKRQNFIREHLMIHIKQPTICQQLLTYLKKSVEWIDAKEVIYEYTKATSGKVKKASKETLMDLTHKLPLVISDNAESFSTKELKNIESFVLDAARLNKEIVYSFVHHICKRRKNGETSFMPLVEHLACNDALYEMVQIQEDAALGDTGTDDDSEAV
jgi:hypothetical protein